LLAVGAAVKLDRSRWLIEAAEENEAGFRRWRDELFRPKLGAGWRAATFCNVPAAAMLMADATMLESCHL